MNAPSDHLAFLDSEFKRIKEELDEIQDPDIKYRDIVPIDTNDEIVHQSIPPYNEQTRFIAFIGPGQIRQFEFFNKQEQYNTPTPAFSNRGQYEQFKKARPHLGQTRKGPLLLGQQKTLSEHSGIAIQEKAQIGCSYGIEELTRSQKFGQGLSANKARDARRSAELILDDIVMIGAPYYGWTGLSTNENITTITAKTAANSTSTKWVDKTTNEILTDIKEGVQKIWSASQQIADTVLVTSEAYHKLKSLQSISAGEAVLDFAQNGNSCTIDVGQKLTCLDVPSLDTAGVNDSGRMILYPRRPEVVKLYLPIQHRFLQAQDMLITRYDVPGAMLVGEVSIELPDAFLYVDGI